MITKLFRRSDTGLNPQTAQTFTPSSASSGRVVGYAMMTVIYAVLLVATTSTYLGDTGAYASNIVEYDRGLSANSRVLLWEAGHLYWRPLGLVLFRRFAGLTPYSRTGEHELAATAVLVAITMRSEEHTSELQSHVNLVCRLL